MEPPVTIDYDEIIHTVTIDYDEIIHTKSRDRILLVIEGDKYWFNRGDVEVNEEEFTVEMSYDLAREKGFV
jgi:hypothetical protein